MYATILKDLEDGAPVKEEDFEEAVYSFLGLDMYQIKNEQKQMEEQLKKQANES